jgi:hypothetical protein
MKKILLSIIVIAMIAGACKKDRPAPGQGAKQNVTFKVGFAQNSIGFLDATQIGTLTTNGLTTNALTTNADTGLTNHVTRLLYFVFDSSGKLLSTVSQNNTDASFGQYTNNLESGTYTIVIAGGDAKLTLEGTTLAAAKLLEGNGNDFFENEAFFSKFTLTVSTTPITQNVTLHRITSYLAVNINDPIPQGVNTVEVVIDSVGNRFNVATETADVYIYDPKVYNYTTYTWADYSVTPNGAPNYRTGKPFLYAKPVKVTITAGHKDSRLSNSFSPIYGKKVITGVTGKQNAVTTLSGNLFGGTQSGTGFKLTIDTAWSAPINKSF